MKPSSLCSLLIAFIALLCCLVSSTKVQTDEQFVRAKWPITFGQISHMKLTPAERKQALRTLRILTNDDETQTEKDIYISERLSDWKDLQSLQQLLNDEYSGSITTSNGTTSTPPMPKAPIYTDKGEPEEKKKKETCEIGPTRVPLGISKEAKKRFLGIGW